MHTWPLSVKGTSAADLSSASGNSEDAEGLRRRYFVEVRFAAVYSTLHKLSIRSFPKSMLDSQIPFVTTKKEKSPWSGEQLFVLQVELSSAPFRLPHRSPSAGCCLYP